MSGFKQERRSPFTDPSPSPPPAVIDYRTNRDSHDSGFSPKPTTVLLKPELKFSIERILGLNTRNNSGSNSLNNDTNKYNNHISHTITPSITKFDECGGVIHHNYYHNHPSSTNPFSNEEYDDEDVDDDEEENDEFIDVDVDELTPASNVPDTNVESIGFVSNYSKFDLNEATAKYQWLQCTRYHPPKIQRSKKAVTKKRKLGRNPRVPFTPHQVSVLEEKFRRTHYLSSMDVVELSSALNLTETRVKIWFQNRRARERRDKEASQRSQTTTVVNNNNNNNNSNNNHKTTNFQPLTIPSVAWPITSPMTTGNYPRFNGALNFRPGYLSSAFRLYSPSAIAGGGGGGGGSDCSETNTVPASCQSNGNRLQPASETDSSRQLLAFK